MNPLHHICPIHVLQQMNVHVVLSKMQTKPSKANWLAFCPFCGPLEPPFPLSGQSKKHQSFPPLTQEYSKEQKQKGTFLHKKLFDLLLLILTSFHVFCQQNCTIKHSWIQSLRLCMLHQGVISDLLQLFIGHMLPKLILDLRVFQAVPSQGHAANLCQWPQDFL